MYNEINKIRYNQGLEKIDLLYTYNADPTDPTTLLKEKVVVSKPETAKPDQINIGEIKPFPYKVTIWLNERMKFDLKVMPGKKYANLEVDIVDREIEFAFDNSCTQELLQELLVEYGNKYSQLTFSSVLLFLNRIPMKNFDDFMEDLDTILHCLEIYNTNIFCLDSEGQPAIYHNKLTELKFKKDIKIKKEA